MRGTLCTRPYDKLSEKEAQDLFETFKAAFSGWEWSYYEHPWGVIIFKDRETRRVIEYRIGRWWHRAMIWFGTYELERPLAHDFNWVIEPKRKLTRVLDRSMWERLNDAVALKKHKRLNQVREAITQYVKEPA